MRARCVAIVRGCELPCGTNARQFQAAFSDAFDVTLAFGVSPPRPRIPLSSYVLAIANSAILNSPAIAALQPSGHAGPQVASFAWSYRNGGISLPGRIQQNPDKGLFDS